QELDREIAPLDRAWGIEASTRGAILDAIGMVIASLDETGQRERTDDLIQLFEKTRKDEDKRLYLDILGHVPTTHSVAALLGVVSHDTNPEMRVFALEGLARIGDPRGAEGARIALDDEYWQVRSAAVVALNRFGDVAAIPALIARLKTEDGRLSGDIVDALSSMTGITRKDNVVLWERWWTENEESFRATLKEVDSDNVVERDNGLDHMKEHGYLLAARRALEKRGLSLGAVRNEERQRPTIETEDPEDENAEAPGGALAGGFKADEQEADALEFAVGQAIGSREAAIRERAFELMVSEPLKRSRDAEKRAALLRIAGYTGTKEASEFLVAFMDKASRRPWRDLDRIAALHGMGFCAQDEQINTIVTLFSSPHVDKDLLLTAVQAMGRVESKESTRGLIRALGELSSRRDKSEWAGVMKAIGDQLRRTTNQKHADDFAVWSDWWSTNGDNFKTPKELVAAEAKPGEEGAPQDPSGTSFYGIETYSKRIAFVLDVSGSMNEEVDYAGTRRTKIAVAKEELLKAIASLPKDAWFNIVFYSSDYRLWQKQLVQASAEVKGEAREWV
ncbi:MAG: HEAT repeat domain-containing protein, partial [Salinibacterium sp.]|nr:HEAT repeat domain-containing protein [Salinibacterium sp.]